MTHLLIYLFVWLFFPLSACQEAQNAPLRTGRVVLPKREFRAFWIVTLDNKDFPSQPGLSTEMQKEELRAILDFHQARGMNAVIFQVRPSADAFYHSKIEPWSEWLMGRQGQAPQPFYDPLAFLVEECHRRNMELHAWFNPYRVVYNKEVNDVSAQPLLRQHPDWVLTYGKHQQLDPGRPEVRAHILRVMMDVVRRYDIDGLQFDDYFYPYKIWKEEFPDERTYRQYGAGFGDKAAWRRHNVDLLVQMVHDSLQAVKPHVKFGVSPIGVWRNRQDDPLGSATQVGQASYDYLSADVRKWLEKGWIDYVAPQLYWSIGHPRADYETLVQWWSRNSFGKHLYIGQAYYKVNNDDDQRWFRLAELPDQLALNRQSQAIHGSIFFRARFLMENPRALSDTLHRRFYSYPALIPPMPWKDAIPPPAPARLRKLRTPRHLQLRWEAPAPASDGQTASYYVVYRLEEGQDDHLQKPECIVSIQKNTQFTDKIPPLPAKSRVYLITAVDRLHNESEPAVMRVTFEE
ncbi:MAG: family 10 glycosylhydrolase [Microscillaceae bacterium]|nr:family 10 glycosylhydrolase [Microscillaceae bacterium]